MAIVASGLAAFVGATREYGTFPGFSPHIDVLLILGAAAVGYTVAIKRFGPQLAPKGQEPISRLQLTALVGGFAALFVASLWPIHDFSEERLFSVHMAQHLTYSMIAAPLLLIGTPTWLARSVLEATHALRLVRFCCRFFPAVIIFNVTLVVTHIPAYVNNVVGTSVLHFLTHVAVLATALIVWMPILSPLPEVPRLTPPLGMLFLFMQSFVPTVPASFLTFGSHPLYSFYENLPRVWGIAAIDDMRVAGLIMKIFNGLVLWTMIAIVFFKWYDREESGTAQRRSARALDRELTTLGLTDR